MADREKNNRKNIDYEDMLTMPVPVSGRAHMSLYQRSAQFMPFAALTGLDDIYAETEKQHLLDPLGGFYYDPTRGKIS